MRTRGSPPWPAAWRLPSRARSRQLLGWFVVGVVAVVGEVAMLEVLVERLGIPLWAASALAAESLMLARFLVTDRWVFGYARPSVGRLGRYHGTCAGAFVVSWGMLNALSALLGLDYRVAWALGTVAALAWSAWSNLLWVWRPASVPSIASGRRGERVLEGRSQ